MQALEGLRSLPTKSPRVALTARSGSNPALGLSASQPQTGIAVRPLVVCNRIQHFWDVRNQGWDKGGQHASHRTGLRRPRLLLPALRGPLFGEKRTREAFNLLK